MEHLLEELECPICTDYLTIPIRQCAIGHSVCGKCITKLGQCALCRNEFTDSRNITLEGLALKMKYPCFNKKQGCNEVLNYSDREKHEIRCAFRSFQACCAMRGCAFVGNGETLKSHWLSKKSTSKIFQISNSSSTKLRNDSYFVNLVEGYGELFWYKCKTFNNTIYFAMQFIGKPHDANQYFFEVEIKASLPRKKIIVGDYCQSLELSDNELFKEETCCTIAFANISQFLVNDYLNYALRLCKNKEASNASSNVNKKQNIPPLMGQSNSGGKTSNHAGGKQNVNSSKQNTGSGKPRKPNQEHGSKPKDQKQQHGGKK